MAYTGGDVLEITYNHSTLGGGTLFVKADEDATIHRGGFRSADDEAMVTADGQMIDTMTNTRWKYESGPIAWDMTSIDEQDKLMKLAGSPILAEWTIQHISGAIFKGKGKPVGEVAGALKNATVGLMLQGGGKLEKIS